MLPMRGLCVANPSPIDVHAERERDTTAGSWMKMLEHEVQEKRACEEEEGGGVEGGA